MEEAVVVGMSTSMMLMVAIGLFVFRKFIFRTAEVLEVLADEALTGVEDTSGTYMVKVKVLNANTRSELANEIADIENIVSVKDLNQMLAVREKPKSKAKSTTTTNTVAE